MGDIVTCAEANSTECNSRVRILCQEIVSIALDAVRQEATTNRMSNMPTMPHQTLSGTFAPRRCVVNAAA